MRDYNQLQSLADQQTMLELLTQWMKASKNEQLKTMRDCVLRNTFYVNSLELQAESFDTITTRMKNDALHAIERARRAEQTVEQLQNELDKVKQSLKAFGI